MFWEMARKMDQTRNEDRIDVVNEENEALLSAF